MTSGQKTVKYIAMGVGLLLAVWILFSIIRAGLFFLGVHDGLSGSDRPSKADFSESYHVSDVQSLDIDNFAGRLTIKPSNELRVEAKNVTSGFYAKAANGELTIENDVNDRFFGGLFGGGNTPEILLYVPEDLSFYEVDIANGAGVTDIEKLTCTYFTLEGGAGEVNIKNLDAKNAFIMGGVGKVDIQSSTLGDCDIESGVGSFAFSGFLTGDTDFTCGVGRVEMEINGRKEDYHITGKTGLGAIFIDGERLSDESSFGTRGGKALRIEGGVGKADIDFVA